MSISAAPSILIVDDDPNIIEGIKRVLHGFSYSILSASSGESALDMLSVVAVDVMVTDENMPGISGADLVMAVRRQFPTVVSIMLSGQASLGAVIRALNQGEIYRFLIKPCNPAELKAAIRHALRYKHMLERCREILPIFRRQARILATLERRQPGIIQSAEEATSVIAKGADPEKDNKVADLLEEAITQMYPMTEMT
jgi:two-component system, probable response regulator PhcQ